MKPCQQNHTTRLADSQTYHRIIESTIEKCVRTAILITSWMSAVQRKYFRLWSICSDYFSLTVTTNLQSAASYPVRERAPGINQSINHSFEKAHKEHEYTANRNSMHTRKQISTHTVSRAARQQKQINNTESGTEIRDLRQDGIISQSPSPWSSMKQRRAPLATHYTYRSIGRD